MLDVRCSHLWKKYVADKNISYSTPPSSSRTRTSSQTTPTPLPYHPPVAQRPANESIDAPCRPRQSLPRSFATQSPSPRQASSLWALNIGSSLDIGCWYLDVLVAPASLLRSSCRRCSRLHCRFIDRQSGRVILQSRQRSRIQLDHTCRTFINRNHQRATHRQWRQFTRLRIARQLPLQHGVGRIGINAKDPQPAGLF